ncbi:hypothetical protein BYT27DRAFT_7119732 [Phlegmacium glaucopus]|nr:hypothetical protein BYT27DRAFT_7119732 [Phlegmacium glaucopus]
MDYCLSCFRKSDQIDEQEPLLSKHPQRLERGSPAVERGTIDKIIDILAAFNAGKLPSQTQLSKFLRNLLKSELLKQDGRKIISSAGPMSKEGRKVLGDVRNLVQAILQFGLEKNDDDKLQQIYFQILQINASQAGETTLDTVKERAAKLNDQVPSQDELAFDTTTFLSALRALVETTLTSSVFRLILADLFAIAQDLVAHGAADVGQAVQQAAEAVEKKAREDDDELIMPEVDVHASIDAVKDQGHQAMEGIEDAARAMKDEWKGVGDDAADKTKQKILERIKEVISCAQKDVGSRAAMRAILVLARKYADRIASFADVAASTVDDVAEQVSESFSKNHSSTSTEYPPSVDPQIVTLLQDIKEMLERLGKGHSLDRLLAALKKVVRELNKVPIVLVDEINKEIEDKAGYAEMQRAKAKGKNKKRGRKKGASSNKQNPLRAYFARIGAYLDRGLDDPGWVMSKEGAEILEGLFDNGVELLGVVGESIIEVGEEIINPDVDQTAQIDQETRVRFKKDFEGFMKEAEAYVSAVGNDKTTMQIFQALDALEGDLSGLLKQGVKKGRRGFAGLGDWIHWIGWAVPRLTQMLPRGAIVIPSVEIKTNNIEGGLYALFVQGLAGGRGEREGGIGTQLIPDEIVLKEWTEMRIDMAERERPFAAPLSKPGLQTTSRVHMHMDGIRAKVEGMGYYFKYLGGLIDYEDAGLLSVDVGMSSLHNGLGVDIEVEMEKNNVEFDSCVDPVIPEIIIEREEVIEHSGNRDIQEAVANGGSTTRAEREIITIVDTPPEPLFNVVQVKVGLAGLRFKIDKSRHWILNKLFLQPLAGPVIAHVVRQALEDKIKIGLHDLALSLGALAEDAKRKGVIRRAREKSKHKQETRLREFLTDWWNAILQTGPKVLGYDKVEDGQGELAKTETRTDVTMKGMMYSSTTTEQPGGTPAMVYNKASGSMEMVSPTLDEMEGTSQPHDETVVAIGGGAQLFPGKDRGDQHSQFEGDRGSNADEGLNKAGEGIQDRWGKRKKAEKRSTETWKSDAFDFA